MEEFEVKLFTTILEKLPRSCRWYVDQYIDDAFKDGQLLELKKYVSELPEDYNYYYSHCIELTDECISYLIRELNNNDSLTMYLCHHSIAHGENLLMVVFDGILFSIHKSFGISDEFIRLCKDNEVYIDVEDPVVL